MSIRNLLSRAKEIFIEPIDQEKLKSLEASVSDAESIRIAMDSEGGKVLKKRLVTDFFASLDNLFKTKDLKYVADLEAIMNFIIRLSSTQDTKDIKEYLESRLKDYGE